MTEPLDDIILDLRGLFPPEPMERVLDALTTLSAGQRLRMLIDREPVPLYRILERNGYQFEVDMKSALEYEIVIREVV